MAVPVILTSRLFKQELEKFGRRRRCLQAEVQVGLQRHTSRTTYTLLKYFYKTVRRPVASLTQQCVITLSIHPRVTK